LIFDLFIDFFELSEQQLFFFFRASLGYLSLQMAPLIDQCLKRLELVHIGKTTNLLADVLVNQLCFFHGFAL